MSKLGLTAAMMTGLWLMIAAIHNTPSAAAEEAQDELQVIETEHFRDAKDPANWGRILEEHAAEDTGFAAE